MMKIVAMAAACAALLSSAAVWAAERGTIGYLSDHTALGVKIYSDLSYIRNESNGTNVDPTGYGFDVKRGYLTLDTAFNDDWSIRFRTDFNYASAIGETNVYIKNLYAQRSFNDGVKLRIGVADMPWIPHMEDLYGYRYVENVLIDRTKFGNSADWGLHLLGDEGKLNWQVSLVTGGGYKHPERSKGMDVAGRLDYNAIGGLHLVVGVYTGKQGEDTTQASSDHNASRYDAAAAYEGSGWNVGVDYFYANDWNNVTTPYATSADGYSLFGSYSLTPTVALFARYDYVKPCKDLTAATSANCYSDTKNTYYNVGVQFIASNQIRFALLYKYSKVDDGLFSTAEGSIGGAPTATGPGEGKYQEIGVFMQASF
ncbi:MAG: porin [Gammaproteobacteria bacterium]